MIWMRGLNAPSESLLVTPNWMGVLVCLRVERLYRGIWTGCINGTRPIVQDSTRPGASSWTWVTTTPATLQVCRREAGKLPGVKGPGFVGVLGWAGTGVIFTRSQEGTQSGQLTQTSQTNGLFDTMCHHDGFWGGDLVTGEVNHGSGAHWALGSERELLCVFPWFCILFLSV